MEFFIYKLAYKEKDTPCILKGLEALTYWHGGSFSFFLSLTREFAGDPKFAKNLTRKKEKEKRKEKFPLILP